MVPHDVGRRQLLVAAATAAGGSLAGCAGLLGGQSRSTAAPVAGEEARRLAESYAPTLYFDAAETWFPTDPAPTRASATARRS